MLTQVNSRELHRHITDLYPSRPLELTPSNLSFVEPLPCIQRPDRERPHLGSADALRSALGRVRYSQQGAAKADDILVVSGQDLYALDFQALVGFHREQGADVTMVTQRYHLGGSERMGLCKLSRDRMRVDRFVEKPSREELRRHVEGGTGAVDVSLGMYVFKRCVLESFLESDMHRELGSIGDDVIAPAVASGMHVAAFEHSGRFTVRPRPPKRLAALPCLALPCTEPRATLACSHRARRVFVSGPLRFEKRWSPVHVRTSRSDAHAFAQRLTPRAPCRTARASARTWRRRCASRRRGTTPRSLPSCTPSSRPRPRRCCRPCASRTRASSTPW